MSDEQMQESAGEGEKPRKRRTKEEIMRDQVAWAERLVDLKRKELEDYTAQQRERRARIEAVEQSKAMLGGFLITRLRGDDADAWRVFEAMERLGNDRDKERYKRVRAILNDERAARSSETAKTAEQAR